MSSPLSIVDHEYEGEKVTVRIFKTRIEFDHDGNRFREVYNMNDRNWYLIVDGILNEYKQTKNKEK